MDKLDLLTDFFIKASKDSRISISHIGLYAAFLQMLSEQVFEEPVVAFASNVMRLAKISSTATYHRLVRELNNYGYIKYMPSYFKGRGSSIFLLNEN